MLISRIVIGAVSGFMKTAPGDAEQGLSAGNRGWASQALGQSKQ